MDNPTKANIEGHIGFLDALRGFLAFWVFYGHLKMASIAKDVLWGSPALAVDGFMLLSGFLMVYHWILRKDRFTTFKAQVKDFYLRRYFRIAPLYYSLLSVAFLFQTKLFNIKYAVNTLVPPPWKGRYVIFDNPVVQKLSLANILSHFSFTFGAIPEFANSNILPDWSIGLEMQFYLLFPLLIILISKLGPFTVTFLSLIASIAANKLFGLYQDPGLLGHFGQPSMILFKINFFLAGMAIAYAYLSRENQARISWLVLGVVAIYGANVQVLIIAAVIVYLLIFDHEGKELITKIGSWKFFKFFGDTSYAVYLVHLLIIYPVLYLLFKNVWFQDQGEYVKLLVSLVIITPIVYGTATILHKTIEIGGIRLGKRITNRLGGRVSGRPQAPSVDV